MYLIADKYFTLQQVQSGCSSHLQDWRSMHLDTMEAHTASLQPNTPPPISPVITSKLVIKFVTSNIVNPERAIAPPTAGTIIYKYHMNHVCLVFSFSLTTFYLEILKL